jgi:hypothetical protein
MPGPPISQMLAFGLPSARSLSVETPSLKCQIPSGADLRLLQVCGFQGLTAGKAADFEKHEVCAPRCFPIGVSPFFMPSPYGIVPARNA